MKILFIPFLMVATLFFINLSIVASNDKEFEFSHKLHVVDQEIECLTCHEQAETSETGKDVLTPSKEVCNNCHAESEVGNPEVLTPITDYSVKFSHKRHLGAGLKCESCHAQMSEKTSVGVTILPKMADCLSCHESKAVSTECSTCHLPSEKLMPPSHTPNFIHTHGTMAEVGSKELNVNMNCSSCHKPKFCQDCHEGENLDRLTHPLNYEFTHALEAQGKEKECTTCHAERTFCIECHAQNQVMPHNHVAGWANNIKNDGGRHKVEALNDLESCMACHEQNAQQVCQPCHGK